MARADKSRWERSQAGLVPGLADHSALALIFSEVVQPKSIIQFLYKWRYKIPFGR